MRNGFLAVIFLALCPLLTAQQGLDNDAIIKMVKSRLSDDVIITTINAAPGSYDTSADGLIALKQASVSDKVIAAIIVKASGNGASPAVSPGPPESNNQEVPLASREPTSQREAEPTGSGTVVASGQLPAGARVVIAPMGGFETYFAAAIREKKVPITLTLDKSTAQYFVVSTETEWQGFVFGSAGSANWTGSSGRAASSSSGSSTRGLEASIMLIDAKSKDVAWAYEVHKSSHGSLLFGTLGARGQQSLAEACAKHLRDYIEKTNTGLAPAPRTINEEPSRTEPRRELSANGGNVHLNAESEPSRTSALQVHSAQSAITGNPALPGQGIVTPAEKSAGNDSETLFQQGAMYETGNGVPRDYAQAAIWYRKAAEENYAPAQYHLGILCATGLGVPIDMAEAVIWFQKAADQGHANAQEALGFDYLRGDGVPRDYGKAFFWLAIAASSKAPDSLARQRASEVDKAAIHLQPSDVTLEEERVQNWLQSHPVKP